MPLWALLGVLLGGGLSSLAHAEPANFRHLDWISPEELKAMPADQRPEHTGMCEGIYLAPTLEQGDPTQQQIKASADSFDTLPDGTNVLSGDVVLKQGGRELYSDEIRLNRESRATEPNGNVVIRQPGMLILGESAKVNLNEKKLDVRDTEYVIHDLHVHGKAGRIYNPEEKILVLDNSSYTTCEPNDNAWAIAAKEIKLDETSGWGEVKGAKIEIGGVPVIYLPWWTFPIDDRRQSGFLFVVELCGDFSVIVGGDFGRGVPFGCGEGCGALFEQLTDFRPLFVRQL